MNKAQLKTLIERGNPIVVEFWAPWCTPCKRMAPILNQVSGEFKSDVQLVRINVDEDTSVAQDQKVASIPTIIAFHQGQRVLRKTGLIDVNELRQVFIAAQAGTVAAPSGIRKLDRILRISAAVGLLLVAAFTGFNPLLLAASGLVFFFAVYDRCPIWKFVSAKFKQLRVPQESAD